MIIGARIKEWFKRTTSVRNPENKVRTESRQIMNRVHELLEEEKKLLAAEKSGDVSMVEKAFKAELHTHHIIALQLIDEFVQVRFVLAKQLRLLAKVRAEVERNSSLTPEQRKETLRKIDECMKEIKDFVEAAFRSITSIESVNTSLKILYKFDTLAQVGAGDYLLARKAIRTLNRDEQRLAHDADSASDAQIEKELSAFTADFRREMESLRKAMQDTILEYQENMKGVEAQHAHMLELVLKQGFPKRIGESLITADEETLKELKELIRIEIEKKRLELSNAARAA